MALEAHSGLRRAGSIRVAAPTVLLLVLALVYAAGLVGTAWMSDDAYITLRSVDNLVNGFGATWNVGERVQAYTHPLWMILLSALYAPTRDAFYVPLAFSMLLSAAAFAIVVIRLAHTPGAKVIAALALVLSKSYIDYSTSGLENPLTHLLLALYLWVLLAPENTHEVHRRLLLLSMGASLLALSRNDAILLVLPSLILAWYRAGSRWPERIAAARPVLFGFGGLFAWLLFALIYYGFPLPNTFYAKVATGLSLAELLPHGWNYFLASSVIDPSIPVVLAASAVLVVVRRRPTEVALLLGMVLYLAYVLAVGGDFMAGRFLTAPYLVAVVLAAQSRLWDNRQAAWLAAALLLVIALANPRGWLRGEGGLQCNLDLGVPTSVADERACFYDGTGLLQQRQGSGPLPRHGLTRMGLDFRATPAYTARWARWGCSDSTPARTNTS